MINKINEVSRRTRGYRFADGLPETGVGILFIMLSIPYLLWSLAPQGSKLAKIASSGKDFVLLFGIILLFFIIAAVKQRSTYPRSGYIEEQRPGRKRVLATIAISAGLLVFAGLLVAGILLLPAFRTGFLQGMFYFPTFLGLIFTFSLVVWSIRSGIKRFYVLAGGAALVSLGLAVTTTITLRVHSFDWSFFTSANPNTSMPAEARFALQNLFRSAYSGVAIFAAIFGLAILVSGLIVRRKYLRENPIPHGLEQEETK